MKIVFVGLASTFTPGMSYQDNELCRQTLADGHSVTYIAGPEKFVNGVVTDAELEDTILPDRLHLIRVPYCKLGPNIVTKKVRKFKGIYEILEREQPDVIFCHCAQYWSVLDVVRYKKKHPEVKLYADTHAAAHNSGTNWLSLHVLHRFLYKRLIQKAIPYLEKYFYIGYGEGRFSVENYAIPEELMEFYPLGGTILSQEDYTAKRNYRRTELGLKDDEILLVHSGKLDALKRTEELLRAFSAVPKLKAKLAIIGSIPDDMKGTLMPLIEAEERVIYLGWKSAQDLQEYLCACDLYCQPGSVSATMQNAECCGCPIMAYPHFSYLQTAEYENVIWVKTEQDMADAFRMLALNEIDLQALRAGSERCARELLDYRKLAARLYR